MNPNPQSRLTPMLYPTFLNFTVTNSMKAAPALTLVTLTLLLAFTIPTSSGNVFWTDDFDPTF